MDKILRLGVVALATALTCVVLLPASPASAAVATAAITSGSFTLISSTGTSTMTIPSHSSGSGCTSDITLDFGTTTTAQITAFSSIVRFQIGGTGTWYVAEKAFLSSTPGTLTGVTTTSATINPMGMALKLDIYTATDQTPTGGCAHGTALDCRFDSMSLLLSGAYSGNAADPSTNDTASLSVGGLAGATSSCTAPFTTFTGGTATVNSLSLDIISGAVTTSIASGSLTLSNTTGTVTGTIPSHSSGSGCTSDVTLSFDPPSVQITTFSSIVRFQLGGTGGWYVAEKVFLSSTAGTLTGVTTTSATINTSSMALRLDIYIATDQSTTGTSCAHGATRTCRFTTVNLSLLGTYTGDVRNPGPGDVASLTGSGALGSTTPPCTAPFSAFASGTVTVNSLSLDVTAVP